MNDPDHAENGCSYVRKNEITSQTTTTENLMKQASNEDQIQLFVPLALIKNWSLLISLHFYTIEGERLNPASFIRSSPTTYTFPKFKNISSLNEAIENSY